MQLKNNMLLREQAYINGLWVDADDRQISAVINPATDKPVGQVPHMGEKETQYAIDAAAGALVSWRKLTAKERAGKLRRWFELMMENQDDLARIMTLEQGKPFEEAKGEISYAASFIEWFSEEAKRTYGETQPNFPADRRVMVIKQPIGVCAAITPWNFPAAMITRKAAPALAAGCTIVVKPASSTPLSALALAVLAEQAGIPAGVFNVITGDAKEISYALTQNPIIRKLSFTGSTQVGSQLMAQCAKDIKKLSLELGGNAPFIVFDDADIDLAVRGAVAAKFRNAGQTCVCVNRFYIHERIYDQFANKLKCAVEKLRVGDGFEPNVDMGPLINQHAVNKTLAHIDDATMFGAKVLCGGKVIKGNFLEPTVLVDVTDEAKVATEETFGPLAALFRFTDDDEVIARANNTEYGLAGYFYTSNISRLFKVAESLECGMVGVNTGLISSEFIPFGGVKASGLGREGSRFGIEDYLEIKCICVGGINT